MTPLSQAAAVRPAEPALFARLVDDAAAFPPGNAPLGRALSEHRFHQATPYAALLGPLLVPDTAAAQFAALVGEWPSVGPPLLVTGVARPGTERAAVEEGLRALAGLEGVELAGAELAWAEGWRDLSLPDVPLALEVPRGERQAHALADLASGADGGHGGHGAGRGADGRHRIRAKFRTGRTSGWPWPDEAELARLIRSAVDHGLAFKLTGGLHHAVRGDHAGGPQHGLLNVLCAVRRALDGEGDEQLATALAERNPDVLVPMVARMGPADAAAVRGCLTAVGCCGVLDPIGELRTLNLIKETA